MIITNINDFRVYLGLNDTEWASRKSQIELLQPAVEAAVNSYVGYNISYLEHTEFLPARQEVLNFWDANILNLRNPMFSALDGRKTYANQQKLFLSNIPVRSVTSVKILEQDTNVAPPDFTNARLLSYGQDYTLEYTDKLSSGIGSISMTGLVLREFGHWPRRLNAVQVVYVSGLTSSEIKQTKYSVIPLAVLQTMAFSLAEARQIQASGTIASESLAGQYSVSYQLPQQLLGGIHNLPPSVKRLLMTVMNMGSKL